MINSERKTLAMEKLLVFLYISGSKLKSVIGRKDMFKIVTVGIKCLQ